MLDKQRKNLVFGLILAAGIALPFVLVLVSPVRSGLLAQIFDSLSPLDSQIQNNFNPSGLLLVRDGDSLPSSPGTAGRPAGEPRIAKYKKGGMVTGILASFAAPFAIPALDAARGQAPAGIIAPLVKPEDGKKKKPYQIIFHKKENYEIDIENERESQRFFAFGSEWHLPRYCERHRPVIARSNSDEAI